MIIGKICGKNPLIDAGLSLVEIICEVSVLGRESTGASVTACNFVQKHPLG